MGRIARRAGSLFLADMAHIAGLVAGGVHPSPVPHSDVVTCTTTKTLRGPRGGMILSRHADWERKLQSAVFPGVQGSIHTQVMAAKAVCLGEALTPEFRAYAAQVKANAATLAATLARRGVRIVAGGTDTHLVLLDVSPQGLTGRRVEVTLEAAGICCNKNPVPFDSSKPGRWVGVRLGSSSATTRGLREPEFRELGEVIADLIEAPDTVPAARRRVASLCTRFPILSALDRTHQSAGTAAREMAEIDGQDDITPVPSEDPRLQRFADLPFQGIRYDGKGNVVDPPPGPKRDRAIALMEAWKRYNRTGDREPLVKLGVFNPEPPPACDPKEDS